MTPLKELSPIVLFVYNRPEHTLRTLESLSQNPLADKSDLIVYADGPMHDSDEYALEKIKAVRKIIRERKWCKSVEIIESPVNLGLAASIVRGISEILNQRKNIIVLEDDLFLSPGFLSYMNNALGIYENEEGVMHISGYMFPVRRKLPETFFLNMTSCWGWATWSRAWRHYNSNASDLLEKLNASGRIQEFTIEDYVPYLDHLKSNVAGTLNTWAIKWHTSVFLQNGYCLHPHKSLVSNIGTDGSGVNSGTDITFMNQPITDYINVEQLPLFENKMASKAVADFYYNMYRKKGILERIVLKLNRLVSNKPKVDEKKAINRV